jgi:hypothetical protein
MQAGRWFSAGWKLFKAGEHAHFGWIVLEHLLDVRGLLISLGVFLLTFFGGALDYLSSPLNVWLGALAAMAFAAMIYVGGAVFFDRRAAKHDAEEEGKPHPAEALPLVTPLAAPAMADWPIDQLFEHIDPDCLDTDTDGSDRWEKIGNDIRDAFSLRRLFGTPYWESSK